MSWAIRYLEGLGVALDISLCALLGGPQATTISMWAAVDEEKKARWACLMCRFLSWLVQPDHCRDQIQNVPMRFSNYLRAIAGLLALALFLFEAARTALFLVERI